MRKIIALLGLIVFYVALAALLGEGLARLLRPVPAAPPGYFWRASDPETGWSLEPNAAGRWYNPLGEYNQAITINAHGLRSPEGIGYEKPEGVFRVLVLGDSYVEALQTPLEASLPQQIGARLGDAGLERVEVVNAGVSGWGTDQQLLWLRSEGRNYNPDLLLLAVYPGNDFLNNRIELEHANVGDVRKPWFALEEGALALHDHPFDPQAAEATDDRLDKARDAARPQGQEAGDAIEPGPLQGVRERLYRHSAFFRWLEPRLRIAAPHTAARLAHAGLIAPGQETGALELDPTYIPVTYGVYETPVAPEWQQAFDLTGALFAALRDEAAGMGAGTAALLVTAPEQVYPQRWQETLAQYPAMQRRAYDVAQSTAQAAALLAQAGIPTLDLLPLFAEAERRDAPRLHLRHDGHWTEAGHRLAGAAAARFLVAEGLTPLPVETAAAMPLPMRSWARTIWRWFVLVVAAGLVISLLWSIIKNGPRQWARTTTSGVGTAGALVAYTVRQRRLELLPLVLVLLLFGGLLIIAQASVVGPFIYTLF